MHIKELERMKGLLSQALGVAANSMSSNRSVVEAKGHIRQAINKIEHTVQTQTRRQQTAKSQYEQWWSTIQAGTANAAMANMSPEARMKTLQQLNTMIAQEQQKLTTLEKASDAAEIKDDDLLTD